MNSSIIGGSLTIGAAGGYGGYINGGYFILSPQCIDLIEGDDSPWELFPLTTLSQQGELVAYKHSDFWQPMDTLREKNHLEELWASGNAPWKTWK